MRAARYITGWARCRVLGARPERLLQTFAEAGVVFWDITPPEDAEMELSVRGSDLERLPVLAAAQGCDCVTLRRYGLGRLWARLRRRRVLCVGLLLLAALLGASRLFVWRVELQGGADLDEGRLRAALENCGVCVGAFWPAFSQDLIRNELLLRLPELRWATVNLRGCTAEVILRADYAPPPIESETGAVKIVASRAGVVTEVHALRGVAAVSEGTAVLEGELLVDGEALGRFQSHGATHALGTVRARCWYEMTAVAPAEQELRTTAGGEKSRWSFVLGKRRINFFKGYSICPSDCVKMTEEAVFSLSGLFSLPLSLVRERYVSYASESAAAPERRAETEQWLYARLLTEIGAEGEVKSIAFSCSETDGMLIVTLRAECEQNIGRSEPMSEWEIALKSAEQEQQEENYE